MLSVLSGVVLVGTGGTTLWWFAPRQGVVHPMVSRPFFDTSIAIAIMGVTAVGVAFIFDGFAG